MPHRAYQLLILIGLLVLRFPAQATSYADPERRDVFSPNGNYVLDVDPQSQTHTVYRAADRSAPLWSFSKPVWHEPYFLSNDGQSVISLAWRHIKKDDIRSTDCIYFWNANGRFKSYPFEDICARPARTRWVGVGPIGSFWRTWYTDAYQDGDLICVKTTGNYAYVFQIKTGNIQQRDWILSSIIYKPALWIPLLLLALSSIIWSTLRQRRKARNKRLQNAHSPMAT